MISMAVESAKTNPKRDVFERFGRGMRRAFPAQVEKALDVAEREVKRSIRTTFGGRGSELAGSYAKRMRQRSETELEHGVFSPLVYAKVQDLGTGYLPGGAIRAKPPLKRLAIPLDDDLRRGGIWPRHYPRPLHVIPTLRGGGRALLVDSASGEPLYVLVYETRFRGKFYLRHALKAMRAKVRALLGTTFRIAIDRGGRR